MALSKFREHGLFNNVRQYLAFYQHNETYGYKGETKLSLKVRIENFGLFGSDSELRSMYEEFLMNKGYTIGEIEKDLECCKNMILTERNMYLSRASECLRRSFDPAYTKIIKSPHGYPVTSGRCDPECCVLM